MGSALRITRGILETKGEESTGVPPVKNKTKQREAGALEFSLEFSLERFP
jgi:hypothetical protein